MPGRGHIDLLYIKTLIFLNTSIRVLRLSIRINQLDQLNLVPVLRNIRLLYMFKGMFGCNSRINLEVKSESDAIVR